MTYLKVLEISPEWFWQQILTFSTSLVIILLEIHLARKKDRTSAGPYAFARKDKIRRRCSVAIFSILAIVCLFVVSEFHLAHLEVLDRVDTDNVTKGFNSRYLNNGLPPFALVHLQTWSTPIIPTDDLLAAKIQTYRHYWWTQQYLAGFLNFALFLQIQSRVRTLRWHTAVCFSWIALTSLSAAECLLFLYITLTPPAKNQKRFKANWLTGFILPILGVIINIGRLPDIIGTESSKPLIWVCIGVPVALSFASAVTPKESMWRMGFVSVHQAQIRVWLPSAAAAFVLHIVSTSETFCSQVPEGAHIKWAIWRHFYEGLLYRIWMVIWNIIGALSEDPAIGGVGCDVLLSSVVLSLWAFISNVSTRGMLRCTVLPGIRTYQISFLDEQKKERSAPKKTDSDALTTNKLASREEEVGPAEEADYLHYNATRSKTPFAEFLDARTQDNTETAQGILLSLSLGLLGGLGVQSAGVYGAGAKRLDA